MASLSCKHRSSRAAYLVVILISRRLKGLAGDLGPSPFPCDVYARATREAVQGFFVSNPQCQSGGLENKCFCCILRTRNQWRWLIMPVLVVSFVPAAASSLIRDVQKANSSHLRHSFRFSCFASCAWEQCKTTTRPKRNVRGTSDDNGFLYRTAFRTTMQPQTMPRTRQPRS